MTSSSTLEWAKDHSHPPNSGKIKAKLVCTEAKARVTAEPTLTPHVIVADCLSELPPNVQLNLPRPKSIKRSLQRQRKANSHHINPDLALANDRSLSELHIPESLLLPFKYYDSGPAENRIIMLTTDTNLDLLRESNRLCGDGTFKAAPALWTQLYTIHGRKNGFTVPCCFGLLPDKRKETYIRFFSQLKSWLGPGAETLDFRYLADFEQGAYLAVQEVFPGVDLEGCYFHLSKSIDSHVKKLGLSRKYDADFDFRIRVKKLSALAFIPLADLVSTFESLASEFLDDELALLSYFENTWIGQLVSGGRRLPPIFPHSMWNLLGRHYTGSTRTTNTLESYHHSFNSFLSGHHPPIWDLLKALHRQQAYTNNTHLQLDKAAVFTPSSEEKERNKRIISR